MPHGKKFDKAKWEARNAKQQAAKDAQKANPNAPAKLKDIAERMGD